MKRCSEAERWSVNLGIEPRFVISGSCRTIRGLLLTPSDTEIGREMLNRRIEAIVFPPQGIRPACWIIQSSVSQFPWVSLCISTLCTVSSATFIWKILQHEQSSICLKNPWTLKIETKVYILKIKKKRKKWIFRGVSGLELVKSPLKLLAIWVKSFNLRTNNNE